VAPEETTTDNLPETVSRSAHQRMTDERNEARAERDTLAVTVTDLGLADKARRHFVEKGVDDPDWAADIALPSIKSSNTEIGDVNTYLDDKFARLYPTDVPATPEGTPPADDGVPTPDAVEPPGFARPSPAAEGAPPGERKFKTTDPEFKALIEADNRAEIERLDKAGLIEWKTAAPLIPG